MRSARVRSRLLAVCLRVGALGEALLEVGDDLVGIAGHRGAVVEQQRRDLVGAGLAPHLLAVGPVGRDLARDERDAQLRQALADAARVGAPFGLVELHGRRLPGAAGALTPCGQRRLSADGLWTASPPPFSLRTRYCGSSGEALTLRPAAVVSEVILRSTTPGVSSVPCELHTTLSPFLNSSVISRAYPASTPPSTPGNP